jgi:TonB family protein
VRPPTEIVGSLTARLLLACCLASLAGARASAQCASPHYRVGQVWEDSKSSVFMAISMKLADFAPQRLVCLAGALKDQFHNRKNITVLMFSAVDAAKYWGPSLPDYAPAEGAKQQRRQSYTFLNSNLHAVYSYDADKRDEHLDISPFGSAVAYRGPHDTKIDLPAPAKPHCHYEIADRCLLALDDISYPGEALQAKVSGTVTLTGIVGRDGRMTRIQVAEASSSVSEEKQLFVREAVNNLRTWRLESAAQRDAIRITYSYVIDTSLLYKGPYIGQVTVEFALPHQLTITGNPRE